MTRQDIISLYNETKSVHDNLVSLYGVDKGHTLMGKCIEASDMLTDRIRERGFECEPFQCFCLYEDWDNCPECCYEEHWIVKVRLDGDTVFLDPTVEQFQWAFYDELPEVYAGPLPSFYLEKEPDKAFLDQIGWTGYYEGGGDCCTYDFYEHQKDPLYAHILSVLSDNKKKEFQYDKL